MTVAGFEIQQLNDIERLCRRAAGDEAELWQCLAIGFAVDVGWDRQPTLAGECAEWMHAMKALEHHRYQLRLFLECGGCDLQQAHTAADASLVDEFRFYIQRLFEEDDEMATTAKRKTRPDSKPAAESPKRPPASRSRPAAAEVEAPATSTTQKMVTVEEKDLPLSAIRPSPENPREDWDETFLRQLGESLRDNGQLSALNVRTPDVDGVHEIIDGETRYRAAQLVGLQTLRCAVVECTDAEAAMARVLSYRQRRDLNPIEEARGLKLLLDKYGCSQRELEAKIGISQGQISNRIRLLELPADWQQRVTSGEITATDARTLSAWSHVPELFEELGKDWRESYFRDSFRGNAAETIADNLRNVTAALSGMDYSRHPGISWTIKLDRLPEGERDALRLIEVPTLNGKPEVRALNTKLADSLRVKAINKIREQRSKKADRDDARNSTADDDARQEKAEAIYAKKLYRYYVAWHQQRLLALLGDPDDQPPVEQVVLWLLYQCGDRQAFGEAMGLRQLCSFGDVLDEAAARETADRFEEVIYTTARRWLNCHFDGWSPAIEPRAILAFARAAKIDITNSWELTEEFLGLHSAAQLVDLAKAWKVELPKGLKRSQLIAEMLDCSSVRNSEGYPLPLPKCLLKPKPVSLS